MTGPGEVDVPPEVMGEFDAALEDYAAEWLWEAEQLFDQWEDDGEGHTVLMVLMDGDGNEDDPGEEVSHGREDQ